MNAASKETPARRPPATGNFRFPKSAKLLKHSDFQHIYKNGKRHFSGFLTAFYLLRPASEMPGPRVGVTVGRALGGAVQRNRIKRRMREAIRFHLAEITVPVDLIFNPKKSVLTAAFSDIDREIKRAFEVVQKAAERHSRERSRG